MVNSYVPEKGDFVMINFNPQAGKEQAGHRPALFLSPSIYNQKTGLCIACPITNSKKGYAFEVDCNSPKVSGVILSDHVKSLDWKMRGVTYKAKASQKVLEQVKGKLKSIIDF